MKRILIAGTIVLLLAIHAGSIFGFNDTFLQLVTLSTTYDLIRVALIMLLLGLLLTAPPRSMYFRIILGAVAGALFIGSSALALQYSIGIMDALIFIEVAIIFALEAIEAPVLTTTPVAKKTKRQAA